ncbi:MAG TPA: amidohydrolase family protein, partial [Stellaceae bacterium]|nr:amidohydrolase family protein [Stellaceae bacterium]
DMHFHWGPKGFADALRQRSVRPRIFRGDDGHEYFESGFNPNKLPSDHDSADARIAEMDKNGVAHAVLSMSPVTGIEALPLQDALPLARAYNDSVAAVCAQYPSRFSAFAILPVGNMTMAVAEFERAMDMPGIIGAVLPGDGFLSEKRAERFAPLMEAANKRHAVFLVHYGKLPDDPTAPKPDVTDNNRHRFGTLDMQSRLSSNMITFCMTDFLKPYPNVTVMSHNLGGNIPFEIDRMDHRNMCDTPDNELPSKKIKRAPVIVDCNSLSSRSIELAVHVYGADKIVFGSDGTDFGMNWTNNAIDEARITEAEKQAIRDGNARRLLARVNSRTAAAAE